MYQASLVAFLASEEENPPIRNLHELINSDYSLVVREGTAMDVVFSNASTESDEYNLNANGKIIRIRDPSALNFVDSMVERSSKASKSILFDFEKEIQRIKYFPCELSQITGSSRKAEPLGMVFKKRWPWTDFFNYHLLVMKESRLMDIFYQRNTKKASKSCPNAYSIKSIVKEPRPVGTNKIISLYVILGIGFATALLCFLGETLIIRQRRLISN